MSAKVLSALLAAVLVAALGGCANPYAHALDNPQLEGPQASPTPGDLRALEPYRQTPYFRDHR